MSRTSVRYNNFQKQILELQPLSIANYLSEIKEYIRSHLKFYKTEHTSIINNCLKLRLLVITPINKHGKETNKKVFNKHIPDPKNRSRVRL